MPKKFKYIKEISEKKYSAIEIYITICPLNLKFDNSFNIDVDPFYLIDGNGRRIIDFEVTKLYINILNVDKDIGDMYSTYNNEIQDYNNFDHNDEVIRTIDGNAKGIYEFYWEIIYDKTNGEVVHPYNYDNNKYIPQSIKNVIHQLVEPHVDTKRTYIKEFWEFSKNIYGHRKEVKDVTNQLVDFNSQNGYTEEGQWVMTTKGDEVYVQDISNGGFTGLDKEGNIVSGSTSDIVRTITKKEVLKEYLQGMSKIGYGTEGEVYSDGKYAYKIIRSDLVPSPEDIKNRFVGKSHPNVVEIYDAWTHQEDVSNLEGSDMIKHFPDNEYTVIKMELLDDLPDVEDDDEFMRVRDLLWYSQDDFEHIKNIKTTDPEVRKMLDAIINAKDYVGYLDVGFHNLMYDSKTGEYKQIDIF